ncbi:MAG: long-chain fatty acid--CoA ligase [Armatimonadetes bacterium]|nr:long-chain fatty acid--CoA ligase [Armatimonadota bacterium]
MDPLNATLDEMFLATAREHGERTAVILGERRVTYRELAGAVGALQAGLQELGVRPGDRLSMLFPNTPQFHVALFAAQACGAEVVPLNCLHSPAELTYVITDSESRWLLASSVFDDKLAAVIPQCPNLQGIVVAGETALDGVVSWDAVLHRHAGTPPTPSGRPATEPAILIYTSGTTGKPKGAMLSHRNLIWDADAADKVLGVVPEDIFLVPLPLFHAYGFTVDLVLPVLRGSCAVLMPKFAAAQALELIEAHRVTVMAAVPTMFGLMLRTARDPDYDLSSLRVAVSGGAALPLEIMRGFEERFGVHMLEGYGPTEAAPVVSVNPLHGVRKPGSVGPPIPGLEVKVVDDDGNPLPVGEVGELCVRGPNVMLGYWNDPEMTAQAIRDGWLHTGDLARLDEDGYIYIVDRKKDMVIVGGMNVYPREVEDVIYQVPGVADAAVVGVPSGIKGEDVVAFVTLQEGASTQPEEIIEHCRQHLAPFKVPREVVIVPELPKTAVGKILRREVRDLARQMLGARR